ncbi:hypothetical protein OAY85_00500 [Gammaproteobacteria bacterium]|nr:hypothetical protein [Gammaproteobacteria bacterium]
MPEWLQVLMLYFFFIPCLLGALIFFFVYLIKIFSNVLRRNNIFLPILHKYSEIYPKDRIKRDKREKDSSDETGNYIIILFWGAGFTAMVLLQLMGLPLIELLTS